MNKANFVRSCFFTLIVCIGLGSAPAAMHAADDVCPLKFPEQFKLKINSTMSTTTQGQMQPPQIVNATLYVRKGDLRAEAAQQSTLMLSGAQKSYVFNHDIKQYAEVPFNPEAIKLFTGQLPPGFTWFKEGSDEVNGKKCDRYKVTGPQAGPMNQTIQVWLDSETKWPVQLVMNMSHADANINMSMNMQANIAITEGAQKEEYFEIPKGYNRVDMSAFVRGGAALPDKDVP